MKLLIIPEYWLPHIFSLVRGFHDLGPVNGVEVCWTNKKWNRPQFGVDEDWDYPACIPVDMAMTMLAQKDFDAAVLTDGTMAGYLIPKDTKRVMLDSADHRYVSYQYLRFADIYLKTQHPLGSPLVGDSNDLSGKLPNIPIVPWPYCVSQAASDENIFTEEIKSKESRVFFAGWGWPKKRADFVSAVAQSVPFSGGLYSREELIDQAPFPESMLIDPIPFDDYIRQMRSSRIALNPAGNGQMCFRTYEIFKSGMCCISQRLDVKWHCTPPEHGKHWFVADSEEDAIQMAKALLDDPDTCERVGRNARDFWERYCQPHQAARRLLQILGWDDQK